MSKETTTDLSNRLAWFLTGAVLGATVALLYAPKAGEDTRRLLAETGRRGKEAVAETGRDIAENGKDMFERGRKLVDDAAELFDRGRKLVQG